MPRSAIRCSCWKGNSAGACPGGNVGRLHLDKADTIPNPLKLAISLAVVSIGDMAIVVEWHIAGKPRNLIWTGLSAFWLLVVHRYTTIEMASPAMIC